MGAKPISLGSMICTVIDPHPGHVRAYNRWYEEDHLYAILLGPGAFAGARFLARQQEKAARQVSDGADQRRGSLLALYWLVGDGSEHAVWRETNRNPLATDGRLYTERDVVYGYSGTLAFAGARPDTTVPVELALDHRYPHLVLSVFDGGGRPANELADRYAERVCPTLLTEGSPVALVTGFVAQRHPDPADRHGGAAGTDLFVVWFCDADPHGHLPRLARHQTDGLDGVGAWVSPFVPTVVGTDIGLDQLGIEPG